MELDGIPLDASGEAMMEFWYDEVSQYKAYINECACYVGMEE